MRTIEDCNASSRFLMIDSIFLEKDIEEMEAVYIPRSIKAAEKHLQEEDKAAIEKYNEKSITALCLPLFTMYAYADIPAGYIYEIVFNRTAPYEHEEMQAEIKYIVHEARLPSRILAHGHKHLCYFEFKNCIPKLIDRLPPEDGKGGGNLGFCKKKDWPQIKARLVDQDTKRVKFDALK